MALTMAFSSTVRPMGVYCGPSAVISQARSAAATVSASRSGVLGGTKAVPGRCRPIISSSIWLELAVP